MMDSDFLYLVEAELANAREKHQGGIHTPHEAYGVIMEEVCEFFDEVRAQEHNSPAMLMELVQIAAMCYRAAEDLHLVGFSPESEWLKSPDDSSEPVIRVGEWQGPFNEPDEEGLKIRELSKVQQPDGTWK